MGFGNKVLNENAFLCFKMAVEFKLSGETSKKVDDLNFEAVLESS